MRSFGLFNRLHMISTLTTPSTKMRVYNATISKRISTKDGNTQKHVLQSHPGQRNKEEAADKFDTKPANNEHHLPMNIKSKTHLPKTWRFNPHLLCFIPLLIRQHKNPSPTMPDLFHAPNRACGFPFGLSLLIVNGVMCDTISSSYYQRSFLSFE